MIISLSDALIKLNVLVNREKTGNSAIEHLKTILKSLNADDAEVLSRIIKKDLRCGTSDTLASRVWPGLVPTFDVMLSHKDISGIKFPAYAQIKSDGARCHMTRIGDKAVAFSRSGKPIELRGKFDKTICAMINDGETLDGELLYTSPSGAIVDRKTGNGVVNKAVKCTISDEEATGLVFASWDIVDYTSTIPYDERIERLTKAYLALPNPSESNIYVLETVIVKTREEAEAFFVECLAKGEEGAMIKNIKHMWQPKRTKDLGKMKAEEVADLKVVGWYYGEEGKQYENGLGGYTCVTSDGLLSVNVGGGYSQDYRLQDTSMFDEMVGKIIGVTYNQKIQDKKTKQWSLFLPRVDSRTEWVRVDKTIANTLEELK